MCRVLGVHRSGYYAWLRDGASARDREDQRLLGLIKHAWLASGGVYGHRKVTHDLREAGETCSRHRVHRLMRDEGLRAEVGYGSKPRHRGGPVGMVDNVLDRDFAPEAPNRVWVTDITYIRTYEGWLFLAAVMDLYSRQIVGWATQPTMTADLVLQALVAAVWKRKPPAGVMIHSDQGSQFTSSAFIGLLQEHSIQVSMDGKGCWRDNVFVERLWKSVKYEEIYLHGYDTVSEVRQALARYFDFYNRRRPHSTLDGQTPDTAYFNQPLLAAAA